jgi:prepilin-type N-terminal cleavage/methylation domain-containing protein
VKAADRGFSLLEVMVSLAIMSLALVVLIGITTTNVRAAQHTRSLTAASFLARAKIAAIEDEVLELGFVDTDQEDEGDFAEEGHPRFRWHSLIEKIELPTDALAQAQQAAGNAAENAEGGSANPIMALAGVMGGFMSALIEPIRVGLEESVRRVTVKVMWDEVGREEQSFEVTAFMTDPAKLDMAVQVAPGGGAGAPGLGGIGAPGAGGAGTGNPGIPGIGAGAGSSGSSGSPMRSTVPNFGGGR